LLNLTLTGTLGVLLESKETGHLPAVAPVLDRLEQLRFRLDPVTRQAVLKLAGEAASLERVLEGVVKALPLVPEPARSAWSNACRRWLREPAPLVGAMERPCVRSPRRLRHRQGNVRTLEALVVPDRRPGGRLRRGPAWEAVRLRRPSGGTPRSTRHRPAQARAERDPGWESTGGGAPGLPVFLLVNRVG
jgi:hypothetical protein